MKQYCDILPEVDVLILGAGLAGLRAGLSALGMLGRPMGASVLCVGSGHVAAGSSFANPNNALGMQVLFGDFEAADFVARAEAVAPPGVLDPSLLRIMARESLHRMEELMVCGVPFRGREKGINGILKARVPACFLPELPSSAVFEHLGQAYAALSSDFRRFGGRLMEGTQCLGLLQVPADSGHAVAGALLRLPKRQDPVMQPARTVILALGGPAPLFAHNIAGPKVSGWSYALLERAGAELLQPGFVQFLWYGLDPLQYLSLRNLVHEGWQVLTPASNGNATQEERWEGIPPELAPLADARGTHCPCAYGSEDNALDRFLLQRRNADGVVLVRQPKSDRAMAVAAVANAGKRRGPHRRARAHHRARTLRLRRMCLWHARRQPGGRGHGPGQPGLWPPRRDPCRPGGPPAPQGPVGGAAALPLSWAHRNRRHPLRCAGTP